MKCPYCNVVMESGFLTGSAISQVVVVIGKILFWNSKEIFVGNSLQRFNEIRHILSSNGIKYDYKIVDTLALGYVFATTCTQDFHPLDCAHAGRT